MILLCLSHLKKKIAEDYFYFINGYYDFEIATAFASQRLRRIATLALAMTKKEIYTETGNGYASPLTISSQDKCGYIYESYEYNPWGILLTYSNKNTLLYTAREFEIDTGLQFNRMRYYNSNLGRFSSKEPFYLEGNNYCYSCNNPVMLKDPYGTLPPWLWPFFVVAILLNTSCGGGEGSYCGYISVTSTEKNAPRRKIAKENLFVKKRINKMQKGRQFVNADPINDC